MISSWLAKVVLGIVLLGVAVLELGSPLVAKAQADDAAHNIADEVAFHVSSGGVSTQERLDTTCREEGEKEPVELLSCTLDGNGDVRVKVRKEAWSLVLANWSVTEGWYRPEASATAGGPSS